MKNYENGISRRFCVSRKMVRKERGREGKKNNRKRGDEEGDIKNQELNKVPGK